MGWILLFINVVSELFFRYYRVVIYWSFTLHYVSNINTKSKETCKKTKDEKYYKYLQFVLSETSLKYLPLV